MKMNRESKYWIVSLVLAASLVENYYNHVYSLVCTSIGGLLNCAALLTNGCKMPVRGPIHESDRHKPWGRGCRFWILCDVIETSYAYLSIGDFLIYTGIAWYVGTGAIWLIMKALALLPVGWRM